MKEIYLGGKHGSIVGNYALVDDADYEWLNKWKWHATKKRNTLYAIRNMYFDGKSHMVKMHRQVLGTTDPKIKVDHTNRNGLDNTRLNIRECTNQENTMNSCKRKGTSKYKGVSFHRKANKWAAQIMHNGKYFHLGLFVQEDQAALAYNRAALDMFGKFSAPNIV